MCVAPVVRYRPMLLTLNMWKLVDLQTALMLEAGHGHGGVMGDAKFLGFGRCHYVAVEVSSLAGLQESCRK